ncbi:MAG: hypothetical protein MJ246_02185 [Clostridia bacterium]|nr:hypothetical protein [Clostridia bacterium]
MSFMFINCKYLYDADLTSFTVSSVTTIESMFQNCS